MANQARPGPREGGTPVSTLLRRRAVRRSAAIAVLALVGSGVYLGVSSCSGGSPPSASPQHASPSTGTTFPSPPAKSCQSAAQKSFGGWAIVARPNLQERADLSILEVRNDFDFSERNFSDVRHTFSLQWA